MRLIDITPRPGSGPATAPACDLSDSSCCGARAEGAGTDAVASTDALPVAIIGAGPVGLAAAAHLVERDIPFVVVEGDQQIAASVRAWGHTRLFSPWQHLVDPAAVRLLEPTGWTQPQTGTLPTGAELVDDYLDALAALPQISKNLQLSARVVSVTKQGMDRTRTRGRAAAPFVVRYERDGELRSIRARAVIDASGTYLSANPLRSDGVPTAAVPGVYGALPDVRGADRAAFAGRHTTVVGAGHSAANTLLALVALAREEPGTRVSWLLRSAAAVRLQASGDDELEGRATLDSALERAVQAGQIEVIERFEIDDVRSDGEHVLLIGRRDERRVEHRPDRVVAATGFRPDLSMLREIRLDLDDVVEAPRRLAPLIDPNVHSCGTVEPHGFRELQHPEQGFFTVGMKSYGRAPTFLLATGYEQVRSVVAWLAGDVAAAQAVELTLPATGVCSTESGDCC